MRSSVKKALAAAIISGVLAASTLGVATPAAAADYEDDGWSYSRSGDDYGEFNERPHCGHRHPGHYVGNSTNQAAVGLFVGATINGFQEPADDSSESCSLAYQPVTDGWGNVVAYRQARVCE